MHTETMGTKGARHGKVTIGGKAAARNAGGRRSRVRELAAAVAETPRRAGGRKDTRRWCRCKPGAEHQPVIVRRRSGWTLDRACGWSGFLDDWWACYHEEACSECGKVLRRGGRAICPDFREKTAARLAGGP